MREHDPGDLRLSDERTERDCAYMLDLKRIEEDVLRPVLLVIGVRLWDLDSEIRRRMAAMLEDWRVFGDIDDPRARLHEGAGADADKSQSSDSGVPFRGWV